MYSTVQYFVMSCSVQCIVMRQYNTVKYSTVQYSTVQYSMMRQYSTTSDWEAVVGDMRNAQILLELGSVLERRQCYRRATNEQSCIFDGGNDGEVTTGSLLERCQCYRRAQRKALTAPPTATLRESDAS